MTTTPEGCRLAIDAQTPRRNALCLFHRPKRAAGLREVAEIIGHAKDRQSTQSLTPVTPAVFQLGPTIDLLFLKLDNHPCLPALKFPHLFLMS
jgi:hypothetical protein